MSGYGKRGKKRTRSTKKNITAEGDCGGGNGCFICWVDNPQEKSGPGKRGSKQTKKKGSLKKVEKV